MNGKNFFDSMGEVKNFFGEDFWEMLTDVMPFNGLKIDMLKTGSELLIVAEAPGVQSREELHIHMEGNVLIIKGEIKRPYVTDESTLLKNERYHGPFQRKIQLPHDLNFSGLKAAFKAGLLYITIPVAINSAQVSQDIPITFNEDFSET